VESNLTYQSTKPLALASKERCMKPSTMLHTMFFSLLMAVLLPLGCQPPDASVQLRPIVDKYVDVWNVGNLQTLDAIIDPKFVRRVNLEPDINGVDGAKKVISGLRTAYPDLKITLEDWIYSDNKSAGRWMLTGTNTGAGEMPPTGKSVKIWGTSILHFANGKITEEWVSFDNKANMEQLGFTMTPPEGENK
jgi:predicted ester cyclase